jgi:ADP-ribose pyrophosphatase
MREPTAIRPKILEREVVHQNDFYYISRVDADFGEFTKHYYVSEHGQRVGLVVTRDTDVLLVRQYRFLLDGLSWEIPGGGVREGENVEAAAVRECREETGIVCRNLTPLVKFHQGLDAVHNFTHIFYTAEFTETSDKLQDATEATEHYWVSWEQCIEMISSGQIADSFTISSLLSFRTLVRNGAE